MDAAASCWSELRRLATRGRSSTNDDVAALTEMMRKLTEAEWRVLLAMKKPDGASALCLAAQIPQLALVKCVLEGAAKVNMMQQVLQERRVDGWHPLHIASFEGFEDVVEVLLECGCTEMNCFTNTNRRPIHYARERGHGSVVKLLEKWEKKTMSSARGEEKKGGRSVSRKGKDVLSRAYGAVRGEKSSWRGKERQDQQDRSCERGSEGLLIQDCPWGEKEECKIFAQEKGKAQATSEAASDGLDRGGVRCIDSCLHPTYMQRLCVDLYTRKALHDTIYTRDTSKNTLPAPLPYGLALPDSIVILLLERLLLKEENPLSRQVREYCDRTLSLSADALRVSSAVAIFASARKGETGECARHRDASLMTINICLEEEDLCGGEIVVDDDGDHRAVVELEGMRSGDGDENGKVEGNGEGDGDGGGDGNREGDVDVDVDVDDRSNDVRNRRVLLEHRLGRVMMHRGTLPHSVLPVSRGKRLNIIVWLAENSEGGNGNVILDQGVSATSVQLPSPATKKIRPPSEDDSGTFTLSPDVLLQIFSHIRSYQTLSMLSKVSRLFYHCATHNSLWKPLVQQHFGDEFDRETASPSSASSSSSSSSSSSPPIFDNDNISETGKVPEKMWFRMFGYFSSQYPLFKCPAPSRNASPLLRGGTEINCLMIGAPGVGKSSLVIQLITAHFFESSYDYDDDYRKRLMVDDVSLLLNVQDRRGWLPHSHKRDPPELGYRLPPPEWSSVDYTQQVQFIVAVYSVTDPLSLECLPILLREFLKTQPRERSRIPVVLVGTKCDVETGEERVSTAAGANMARKIGTEIFYEASSKARVNVEEAFYDGIRCVRAYQAVRLGAPLRSSWMRLLPSVGVEEGEDGEDEAESRQRRRECTIQ